MFVTARYDPLNCLTFIYMKLCSYAQRVGREYVGFVV